MMEYTSITTPRCSDPWVMLEDYREEETLLVRKSDILNVTCNHLNIDDVRWYVLLDMHTPTTQLCPDTDDEHPEPTQWANTRLIEISSEAAVSLLNMLESGSGIEDLRVTLPDCPVCGGKSIWYTDIGAEQGIRCLNDEEHRSYAKWRERHTSGSVWDNFQDGKFGSIDDYPYEDEDELPPVPGSVEDYEQQRAEALKEHPELQEDDNEESR